MTTKIEWRRGAAGANNPNWRGGKSVTNHGYILVRVGIGHHLSDVRGYAYEHRIVAEKKLGRRLRPGELVHHMDGDKKNNRPENLKIANGNAGHFLYHRKNDQLRKPGEKNQMIACKCGCGERLEKFDNSGRPRKYIPGHNMRHGQGTHFARRA